MRVHSSSLWQILLFLCALAFAPAGATAQTYNPVVLNPIGYGSGSATGIVGSQQIGWALNPLTDQSNAMLWNSSSTNYVDLNPSGWFFSQTNGSDGAQQVGDGYIVADNDNNINALLWSGTAMSWVDLNPSNYTYSIAYGTNGAEQVGTGLAQGSYLPNAIVWSGSASSFVDINPTAAGYISSVAYGISGSKIVGDAYGSTSGNELHAILWNSASPTNYVDLDPPSGYTESVAVAVSGNIEVGYADSQSYNGASKGPLPNITHAMMWTGTNSSYIDLNPASGWTETFALGTNGSKEVGYGYGTATDNQDNALIWSGSNTSYVDLQSYLPSNFISSVATGMDPNGNVVGYATDAQGISYAILWVDPPAVVPEPVTASLIGAACVGLLLRRRPRL